MAGLSAGLRIHAVEEDYIAPSQVCVVQPVEGDSMGTTPMDVDDQSVARGATSGQPHPSGLIRSRLPDALPEKGEIVTVSLADCLACSGCITSAESILISSQTKESFLENVGGPDVSKRKFVVVSLSPQSIEALAHHFSISLSKMFPRLVSFLHRLGVKHVFDTSASRDVLWKELGAEFADHLSKTEGAKGPVSPLVVSSCPGWVCYAEKKHGDLIIPFLSKVKSPQQLMGRFLKEWIAQKPEIAWDLEKLSHTTIMPCYDKKLEASRSDFDVSEGVKEVDDVLTTSELLTIIESESTLWNSSLEPWTYGGAPADRLEALFAESVFFNGEYATAEGGGSGGYVEEVLRQVCGINGLEFLRPGFSQVKNPDFLETDVTFPSGRKVRLARVNGFRNVQNFVRKVQRKQNPYDFVEIMACPKGCLNGGGQIPLEDSGGMSFLDLQKLDEIAPRRTVDSIPRAYGNEFVEWLRACPGASRTQFHERQGNEKKIRSLAW